MLQDEILLHGRMDAGLLFEQYRELAREYEALANINNDVVEGRNLFEMKINALEAERDSLRLENESLKVENKKQNEDIFNLENAAISIIQRPVIIDILESY